MTDRAQIWLAIRLPYLPLQVFDVALDDACIMLSARQKVIVCTPYCHSLGVREGMSLPVAQSLVACECKAREPERERARLTELCDRLYQYTPYISTINNLVQGDIPEQGLLLELSRCTDLFKGLASVVQKIDTALQATGLAYDLALANNRDAAHLLSYANVMTKADISRAEVVLAQAYPQLLCLPVTLLKARPALMDGLGKMGFVTIADIVTQCQRTGFSALKQRFHQDDVHYLAGLLACINTIETQAELALEPNQASLFTSFLAPEPVPVYTPECHYRQRYIFDSPVQLIAQLSMPMQMLLQGLADYLIEHQLQCAGVQWELSDIYHQVDVLTVRCEPIYRDWQLLLELSHIQLAQHPLPFAVNQIELCQPLLMAASLQTDEMHLAVLSRENDCLHLDKALGNQPAKSQQDKAVELTIARIKARLGEDQVFKVSVCDDNVPEYAHQKVAVNDSCKATLTDRQLAAARPGWILNTPVFIGQHQNNLRWHGVIHLVRGPERIEAHWWNEPKARDYYVAVRDDQVRLWVFNDLLQKQWFVQGVF